MKKRLIFLFLAILSIFSCIGIYFIATNVDKAEKTNQFIKAAPAVVQPQNVKIVALGDSLTEGVGDITEKGGYLPYLQSLLEEKRNIKEVDFENFGIKGYRSDQLVKKVENKDVLAAIKGADMVIMTIGGNDMMKVVRENITSLKKGDFTAQRDLFKENLSAILEVIKSENPDIHIVLVGLYNPFHKWFPDIEEMNEVVSDWNVTSQEILAQYPDTYYVEIMSLFENDEEELLYTDYFHPNNRGYELIAGKVYEELEKDAIEEVIEQKWLVQQQGEL
ncbi:SGNH/GDSL hydrolase family protein [Niallia oryzisoli]|uniref:SGNH/GDSL hydrolase family protein n=1 Tax=Niallia oryzisoli TaxID=1737571 RepID=A0ABZ2C6F7_9BACI